MIRTRWGQLLGVVAAVAVVSYSAFAARIYPYAGVETNVGAECFPTTNLGLGDYAYDDARVTTGPVEISYVSDGWPTAPSVPGLSSGGHMWRAKAAAALDLADGIARLSAATDFRLDNSEWLTATQPVIGAGFSQVSASIEIRDTITLSAPATVVFSCRLEGRLSAFNSHPEWQSDPSVGAAMSIDFTSQDPIPGDPDGMHYNYGNDWRRYNAAVMDGGIALPGDWPLNPYENIDEAIYLSVDLPAGTSLIDIDFGVWVDMDLYVNPPVWSSMSGDADFGNTMYFQFIVPENVQAVSGSGLLPIVVPEPVSLILLGMGGSVCLVRGRKSGRR